MSAENHDWHRTIRHGETLAVDAARANQTLGVEDVMWALFREAVETSRSYSSPPRTGYPSKSAMPEAPDEISPWARIMSYLQGEIQEMPVDGVARVRPSAAQISRADAVLYLWHTYALPRRGHRKKMRQAVYAKAAGVPYRLIKARTGISRTALYNAQQDAMQDMWTALRQLQGK